MSRKRYSGGGAGIEFVLDDANVKATFVVTGTFDRPSVKLKKSDITINSFDAVGYGNGMRDVNGKRVFSGAYLDCVEDATEVIRKELGYYTNKGKHEGRTKEINEALEDGLECYVGFHKGYESVIFRGYSRGTLKKGDEVEFDVNLDLDSDYFSTDFDSALMAVLSEYGERWYHDVFEYIPDDKESNWYYDDLEYLYGN